jgi:hypothetical protein
VFVYTISNFCSRYTHDLGSTWELGSGFATSFYLSSSLVKNKLKVKNNFAELLSFVNYYVTKSAQIFQTMLKNLDLGCIS